MSRERQIIDRWIEKLLDTGKRNNLINFKDAKLSTAEIVFPDDETIFSRRDSEYTYAVYEPPIDEYVNEDNEEEFIEDEDLDEDADSNDHKNGKLSPKEGYIKRYSKRINSKCLLVYSATTNPITALKSIAKKARELQDETGVNASYLAFGFVRWKEKDDSKVSYKAPILLVHANVMTGSVIDPVKIQISDDDVVVNPTFNYKLQSDFGVSLPDFDEDYTLDDYFSEVAEITDQLGWEIVRECKLGIFSFLKLSMYEDLKNNVDLILKNDVVKTLIGVSGSRTDEKATNLKPLKNPLVELHTVVDADSSQMEAVEMAKSGKSFVLQGPPGTGKSQTITNIIAECLYDGKKVLFVSEKQAALNVVFEKLKSVGLEDFCLELHSHKANKKTVIEELNRTLESPRISVSSSAAEEIRQRINTIASLDGYVVALHKRRDLINLSLFELFERYSALRSLSDFGFRITDIQTKGAEYFHDAIKLLDEYVSFLQDVGGNYRENAWYGFTDAYLSFNQKNQLKKDIETLLRGYEELISISSQFNRKFVVSISNFVSAKKWASLLSFLATSDVITPHLLDSAKLTDIILKVKELKVQSYFIAKAEREKESVISSLCARSEQILVRNKKEFTSEKEKTEKEFDLINNNIKMQLDKELSKLQLQLENATRKVQDQTTSALDSLRIKHEAEISLINKSASENLETIQTKHDQELTSEKEKSSLELSKIQSRHDQIVEIIKKTIFEYYTDDIIDVVDGEKLFETLNRKFHSVFSRIFNNEYKIYIETTLKPYLKKNMTLSYKLAKKTAILLKKLQEEQEQFDKIFSEKKTLLDQNVQQIETTYKEKLENNNLSLKEQLREAQISYDEAINNKRSENESKLSEFQKSYEDIVSKKKNEHEVKLLENQKNFEERLKTINDKLDIKIPKLKEQHESVIENKSAEYENKIRLFRKKFDDIEGLVKEYLGPSYKGLASDWDHIIDSLNKVQIIHFDDKDTPLIPFARTIMYRYNNQFIEIKSDTEKLLQTVNSIESVQERITSIFSQEIFNFNKQNFNICLQKLHSCLSNYDKLDSWIAFIKILQNIEKESLLPYVDQTIKYQIPTNKIVVIFEKVFYKNWIDYIIYTDQCLSSFTRNRQDHLVAVFSEKDKNSFDVSKVQIKANLSRLRPNLNVISGGGPVALLMREGKKKRKQISIRRLLSETNELSQILKPCFLMSPLSVSSLLDPDTISFDVVIFDEASQVFPQDALGAIYRAKQMIVVGDSKQMPPSNFFNSSSDSYDDDEEDVSDFESILDICSSVFTTKRLLWHYRSRYEDLISFSNVHFYESSLVTFPSASTIGKDVGVNHHFVAGVFDRKTKTNEVEAAYIVDLVFKNIIAHPERSLGVVAFSISQQKLIDKLITRRREKDSSFEWFFDSNRPGSFFVKNLETVQGDERDTIIFSVAYARDADGRFLHNFGPLNRAGGERRLNVAITRAKDNVQFVSSIRYTDIDTGAAKSEGARLLKAYLNYAENGNTTLQQTESTSYGDFQDQNESLEEEIAEFLRDHGYVVELGIGNSTPKIDLGVKTTNSNNYVMAIECDGRYYREYKNARDRDRLRRSVLENMGWNYYRIWSTNWIRNKPMEQNLLLLALKEAEKKIQIVPQPPKPFFSVEKPTKVSPVTVPYNEKERTISNTSKKLNNFETKTDSENFPRYKLLLNAMEIMFKHHATANKDNFQDAVLEILLEEAPISESSFLKRIVGVFERERVSKYVDQEYEKKISNCIKKGIIRRNGFLYLRDQKYTFRIPGDKREINNIAIEELAEGLLKLIEENIKIERENLYKILTRLLCVSNTWTTRYRLNEALELLKEKYLVKEEGGFLRLKSSS